MSDKPQYQPPYHMEFAVDDTRFEIIFTRHGNMTICAVFQRNAPVLDRWGRHYLGSFGAARRNPKDKPDQRYADRLAFKRAVGIGGYWANVYTTAQAKGLYRQFRHWQRYGAAEIAEPTHRGAQIASEIGVPVDGDAE
jgi:hypothetical protein